MSETGIPSLDDLVEEMKTEHAAVDRSSWPKGVEEMSLGDLSRLGVDAQKRLYYDGRPVEVRRRLDLSRTERWFAVAVGFFTIIGSVGAVAQGWAAAHQWACVIEATAWHCPRK